MEGNMEMVDKRMFSNSVVETDKFNQMPVSARLLYFMLGMKSDDDGFVSSPYGIVRVTGCSNEDYNTLIQNKFIIAFDSGVCVITHHNINNYKRSDRYVPTVYQDEYKKLFILTTKAYSVESCIQNVNRIECVLDLPKVQEKYKQWFRASDWLMTEPHEILLAKDCFNLWVNAYDPTRRGSVNELRPLWECRCKEYGIQIFIEKFELAFAKYGLSEEVRQKKIMSAKKFLDVYENWYDMAKIDKFDIEPGIYWEQLRGQKNANSINSI